MADLTRGKEINYFSVNIYNLPIFASSRHHHRRYFALLSPIIFSLCTLKHSLMTHEFE